MAVEQSYRSFSGSIGKIVNTCVSFAKILLISKFGNKPPRATSSSCIVLGNGPSLKDSLKKHPTFFKQHPLVCVNSFSITDEYALLQPQHYVILDYSFWKSDQDIILKSLEAIKTRTSWKMDLLVPQMASGSDRFEKICKENKNIHLTYYNYTVFKGIEGIAHYFYAKNLAMPQSQNVLVASLFLTVNMGYKNIYLFGADHTWHETLHVDDNNTLCLKHIHFYDDSEKVNYVPFYKGGHTKETFRMDEIFVTWAKVFWGYLMVENYAKKKNARILNASEISFIDAFERIKL